MIKRCCCLVMAAVLAAVAFSGCTARTQESLFTQPNEIYTYEKIDSEKTQIVVSRTGNIPVEQLCNAFEALNPDIQVIIKDITGGNSKYNPLYDWVESGDVPDIVVLAGSFFNDEFTLKYFENLSADPIVQNYEADALWRTATNDNVYWLPGPSDISAITYNKTLFEQYGWDVPATFDEFVALCVQIREDTNGEVEPWNPNAKYGNELITAIEAFTYEELFGGVQNRAWYNDFLAGAATFSGHMEPYTEVLDTLIGNGILREEHFTYSATARGKEFLAGDIAMVNGNISNYDSDEFEFGLMPFPTTEGDIGYICSKYSCYVGVPVKEHTEAQREAIKRFLEYFSSPEGQQAYIGSGMKISNVKGMPLDDSSVLAALKPAVDAGHMFGMIEFTAPDSGESLVYLHGFAEKMVTGEKTGAQCIAEADEGRKSVSAGKSDESSMTVAVAVQDMTILETSFLMADAYRQAADADIGLITNNEAYRGNLMEIYAGNITPGIIEVLKPRSFANDSTLIKVSMTGQQLLDALNNPVGNGMTANCIYAYSGLKCEVAPWNELGAKYVSVTLADGSPLEPDAIYTVACWSGTVPEEYITEVLESYEGTWEELMSEKLRSDAEIAPADDGRITLIWE